MAASSSTMLFAYSPNQVPIFDGGSYDYWSSQMQTIFISQDLWDIIEDGYKEPPGDPSTWTQAQKKQHKENIQKDASALRLIHQGVSKSIFPRIFRVKKAKEAWEILQMEFQGNDKAISIKLQTLWTDFDNLLMKESEGIKAYFSRVSEIVNQIQSCGDTIQEKKVVEKILRSLTQKFEHVVPAIEESKDLSKLSMYELMGSLETHEKRMSRFSSQSLEQAFQSTVNISEKKFFNPEQDQRGGSSQRRGLYGRGRGNHNSGRGRGRERRAIFQQKSGNSNPHCYVCKKPGQESKDCRWKCTKCKVPNHSQRDCWYQNKDKKETSEANFTQEDAAEQLFYSCMNVEHNSQNVWYLDNGCSNHMTGNREIFVELDGNYSSQVKLGDGKSKNVEGKGIVSILTKGAWKWDGDSSSAPKSFEILEPATFHGNSHPSARQNTSSSSSPAASPSRPSSSSSLEEVSSESESTPRKVAERALFLWNNDHIENLIKQNRKVMLPIIFPALEKNARNHWNQAVHSLTLNVRKIFFDLDPELFKECLLKFQDDELKEDEVKTRREATWKRLEDLAAKKASSNEAVLVPCRGSPQMPPG
ncbi:hypothetical protein F0562_034184 [Nyssa sinensis]|uniref:Retrovirus-related Pol polyprotein from transposon TNT 1-94-like beta-barrel domain-containing protein n=1 Tax=Nyssa sinensis TaxID=561372 RepID=A0A5J5AJ37_9ASTE|nr:hypothetical protein F0562_034184 [Nyssa sinensis]